MRGRTETGISNFYLSFKAQHKRYPRERPPHVPGRVSYLSYLPPLNVPHRSLRGWMTLYSNNRLDGQYLHQTRHKELTHSEHSLRICWMNEWPDLVLTSMGISRCWWTIDCPESLWTSAGILAVTSLAAVTLGNRLPAFWPLVISQHCCDGPSLRIMCF